MLKKLNYLRADCYLNPSTSGDSNDSIVIHSGVFQPGGGGGRNLPADSGFRIYSVLVVQLVGIYVIG